MQRLLLLSAINLELGLGLMNSLEPLLIRLVIVLHTFSTVYKMCLCCEHDTSLYLLYYIKNQDVVKCFLHKLKKK